MIEAKIISKVSIPSGSCLLNSIPSSSSKFAFTVINPSPNIKLNTGPATHPVMAISPKPFLEIEMLAKASPTEFPQESTVNPRIAVLIPVSIPNKTSKSTIMFAIM
jgi:hypothetical protein